MNNLINTVKAITLMFAAGAAAGAGVVAGGEGMTQGIKKLRSWAEQRRLRKTINNATTIEHAEVNHE